MPTVRPPPVVRGWEPALNLPLCLCGQLHSSKSAGGRRLNQVSFASVALGLREEGKSYSVHRWCTLDGIKSEIVFSLFVLNLERALLYDTTRQ